MHSSSTTSNRFCGATSAPPPAAVDMRVMCRAAILNLGRAAPACRPEARNYPADHQPSCLFFCRYAVSNCVMPSLHTLVDERAQGLDLEWLFHAEVGNLVEEGPRRWREHASREKHDPPGLLG